MEGKMDNSLMPWRRDCQFQDRSMQDATAIFDWEPTTRDQGRNRRRTNEHAKYSQPLHYPQPKSWCDFGNSMQASSALSRWQKERSWCSNGSIGSAAAAAAAASNNGPSMDFIFNMWEVYMPCGFWEGKNSSGSSDLNQMESHGGMNRPPLAHMHGGPPPPHMFSPPPQPPQSPHPPPHHSINHHPMSGGPENLSPISQHAPLSAMSSQASSMNQTSPLVIPKPTKPPGTTIKTYHCRMCDQIFDSKSDLLVHSQHVHKQDPKPYKCQTCQKCFANSSYLSQHARIHSGVKPYRCTICERRFTQLCHLQQHIRTHTGEKPYKCQHPGCGKAFSQLSNLQSHSRSHMTDKPYRCNSCYKCFIDEQSLRDHIPKHSETKHLKTNICNICGKSYTQETYLARHMTKHSGESSPRSMMNSQKTLQHSISAPAMSSSHQQQGPDLHDMKSPMEQGYGNGGGVPLRLDSGRCMTSSSSASSAFMPLPQFSSNSNMSSLISTANTVPSSFPFGSPRFPTTLSSPLSHISPPPNMSMPARSYFPFDQLSMPKGVDPMMERSHLMAPRNMAAASQLLSLQQIKEFSTSHPVFPKSEPSSPLHCHKDF